MTVTNSGLARSCVVEVGSGALMSESDLKNLVINSRLCWSDNQRILAAAKRALSKRGRFELIARSIKSFGFSKKTYLQSVYNKAQKEGLQLCNAEMVVRLVEFSPSMIRQGKALIVAMTPIANEYGKPEIAHVNGVQKPNKLLRPRLCLVTGEPFAEWPVNTEVLFCRPL